MFQLQRFFQRAREYWTPTRSDLLWLVPLALGVVHALQSSFAVTDDFAAVYLSQGLNIYLGEGYSFLERGPLFSIFIAISFALLGVSVASAFWVIKLFTVLNVLLVYIAGRDIYDRWTGFAGATLVATAFTVTSVSLRHLDVAIGTFMLGAVIATYRAFERRQRRWFVLTGVVLGAGFLVKEVTVLLFPLPVALYVLSDGTGVRRSQLLVAYASCLLVILPWVLYVTVKTGNPALVLGVAREYIIQVLVGSGTAGGGTTSLLTTVVGLPVSLVQDGFVFFRRYLYAAFSISVLFVLAWLLVVHRGLQQRDGNLVLGVTLLLLVPLLIFETRAKFRPGQLLIFFLLSYVCIGQLVVTVAGWVHRVLPADVAATVGRPSSRQLAFVVCLVLALTTVQVFAGPKDDVGLLEDSIVVNAVQGERTSVEITGNFRHDTGHIRDQLPVSDRPRVLTIPRSLGDQLTFESKKQLREAALPYTQGLHRSRTITGPANVTDQQLLYLTSHQAGHLLHDRNHLRYLTQQELFRLIEDEEIEYIVSYHENTFLTAYFDRHPQFELIYSHDTVRIYEPTATALQPIRFTPRVKRTTTTYLTGLAAEQPATYNWYRETVLEGHIGLNDSQISSIESGEYSPYFVPTAYDPLRFETEADDE